MEIYDTYANTPCRNIPVDYMKDFILKFLYEASQDMGQTFDKELMCDRINYIINNHYNHLPLNLIASAFKKGSLGQYGAGRLIPRTVFGWLSEINQYYITIQNKKPLEDMMQNRFTDLQRFPLGKAIIWKIDHVRKEDWEKIPIKEVASLIGKGKLPTLEHFGIKYD